jgi:hypothetical protein
MHAIDLLRWLIAVPLGLLGWWIVFLNFWIVVVWIRRREHHSFTPLLGGFIAFIGMGISPQPQIQKLAWLPLGIDAGWCALMLIIGICGMIVRSALGARKRDSAGTGVES